jgi:hypothetical protein
MGPEALSTVSLPIIPPTRLAAGWLRYAQIIYYSALITGSSPAWSGHSAEVLLRIYAKCIDGPDAIAKPRISEALRE